MLPLPSRRRLECHGRGVEASTRAGREGPLQATPIARRTEAPIPSSPSLYLRNSTHLDLPASPSTARSPWAPHSAGAWWSGTASPAAVAWTSSCSAAAPRTAARPRLWADSRPCGPRRRSAPLGRRRAAARPGRSRTTRSASCRGVTPFAGSPDRIPTRLPCRPGRSRCRVAAPSAAQQNLPPSVASIAVTYRSHT